MESRGYRLQNDNQNTRKKNHDNLHDNIHNNIHNNLHDNLYDNIHNNSYDNSYNNSYDNSYDNSYNNLHDNSYNNTHDNTHDNSHVNSHNNSHDNLSNNMYNNLHNNLHNNSHDNSHDNLYDNVQYNTWEKDGKIVRTIYVPEITKTIYIKLKEKYDDIICICDIISCDYIYNCFAIYEIIVPLYRPKILRKHSRDTSILAHISHNDLLCRWYNIRLGSVIEVDRIARLVVSEH